MEIIRHLSDEHLRRILLDSDQQALQPVLQALPEMAQEAAEREEHFWSNQREAIWSRIVEGEKRRKRMLGFSALAAAAAMLVIGGLLVAHRTSSVVPIQVMSPRIDPDQELLVAVEDAVESGGPAALEPAAMLADEINRHATPVGRSDIHKKEAQDAN